MQKYLLHTDKVLTPKDYADALAVQSAPDLCAISRSYAEVVQKIWHETGDREWCSHHPIIRLYLEQMVFIAGGFISDDNYSAAAEVCRARSLEGFVPPAPGSSVN